MKKETYDAALRFVNKILRYYKKKPVKKLSPGRPGSFSMCPISQTLADATLSGRRISTGHGHTDVDNKEFKWPGFTKDYTKRGPIAAFVSEVDRDSIRDDHGLVDPATLVEKPKAKKKKAAK